MVMNFLLFYLSLINDTRDILGSGVIQAGFKKKIKFVFFLEKKIRI